MSYTDDLRKTGNPALWEAADYIEQLEAKIALYEELERRIRSAPVYPGLGVEMALLAIEKGAS